MTNEDIIRIGDEMVRVLEPVYKQLDKVEGKLDKIEGMQEEHTDKIDALIADTVQLQDEIGVIKDDLKNIRRELKDFDSHNQKEHNKIKKHIRMPIVA